MKKYEANVLLNQNVINDVIRLNNYTSYAEIGCDNRVTLDAVNCKYKIGIDPYFDGDYSIGVTDTDSVASKIDYRMTSDEFFNTSMEYFDVIFIDGKHTKEQAERDFWNAICHLNVGGTILIHDVNPHNKERNDCFDYCEFLQKDYYEGYEELAW